MPKLAGLQRLERGDESQRHHVLGQGESPHTQTPFGVVQRQGADSRMVAVPKRQASCGAFVQAPDARRLGLRVAFAGNGAEPGNQPAVSEQQPLACKLKLRAQVNVQNFENVLVRFEWHP